MRAVVAADVYTTDGQRGRGGWTWYTGSASWMYRVGLEAILGFTRRGDSLQLVPCVPAAWKEFADGRSIEGTAIPLVDDGRAHSAVFRFR